MFHIIPLHYFSLAAMALAAAACSPVQPVPELALDAPLPDVAAAYRTTVTRDGDRRDIEWRFWREPQRVVTENLSAATTEEWQRDGQTLFLTRFFHADRRGVEFQMDDLRMLDALPTWTERAALVAPKLLTRLTPTQATWQGTVPVRRYRGEIDGVSWDISIRVDFALPLSIERRTRNSQERTVLLEAYPFERAAWQPTRTDGYDVLDFADLGDHERDPFAVKVQNQIGLGHVH